MPYKAPSNCTRPGCHGVVRDGVCSVCGPKRRVRDKDYDKRRPSRSARGYDRRWQKIRRMQLTREPLCQDCKDNGRVMMAVEVHHIVALRDGGTHDFENLRSLCKTCHSKRTNAGE